VLPKPARDQRPSLCSQFNLADAPVARVIFARDEAFFDQSIDCDADGARREPDFWADGIHRERALMQENFQDAEIRVAQFCLLNALRCVGKQRLKGFHENEPDMNAAGVLRFSGWFSFHKLFVDYDYIDVNIL